MTPKQQSQPRSAEFYRQGDQLPFVCPKCKAKFNYFRLDMAESIICPKCHWSAKPDNPEWGEWRLVEYAQ